MTKIPSSPRTSGLSDQASDRVFVDEIVAAHRDTPGALLPVLHEIQRRCGYIPRASIARIASGLNLSRAEVHGVVGFYHDFRTEPPGHHVIRICRAESCQAMGAVALQKHIEDKTGASVGESSADGEFTIEPVYCFGNCACSPAVMIDGELYGRVTNDAVDAALERARDRASREGT